MEVRLSNTYDHPREEMTAIVMPRPGDGITPTLFSGLGNHTVIHFERQVILGLKGCNGLYFEK